MKHLRAFASCTRDIAQPGAWRHLAWRICLCLGLLCATPLALAADVCFVSANPVAFGVYTPTDPVPVDGASSITVECQGAKTPITVAIDAGVGSGATAAARRMTAPLDTLQYGLFLDPARLIAFGDGSSGSQTVSCVTGETTMPYCNGSNPSGALRRVVIPFYGRIPALQDVASGSYSDTIGITVTF